MGSLVVAFLLVHGDRTETSFTLKLSQRWPASEGLHMAESFAYHLFRKCILKLIVVQVNSSYHRYTS